MAYLPLSQILIFYYSDDSATHSTKKEIMNVLNNLYKKWYTEKVSKSNLRKYQLFICIENTFKKRVFL